MTSEVVAGRASARHEWDMLHALASFFLVLTAAINLPPVVIALAPSRAVALYGVAPEALADPVTRMLLRHRAVLFGVLSVWLFASVLVPELRPWAIGSALVVKTSFHALYLLDPAVRAPLRRIALADALALALLTGAGAILSIS